MSTEAALEMMKLLAPAGSVAVVLGILAYRSPQLVKEVFAGVGGLLVTIQKIKREKAATRPAARAGRRSVPTLSANSRDEASSRAA